METVGNSFHFAMAAGEIWSGTWLNVKSIKLSRFCSVSILTNDFSLLAKRTSYVNGSGYSPNKEEPESVFLLVISLSVSLTTFD